MPLWRVDINHLSHRYVDTETPQEARSQLIATIVAGLDLEVTPASREIADAYLAASPMKRQKLLAALDGLAHPLRRAGERRATRRKLARMVLYDVDQKARLRRLVNAAPPTADPARIDAILRLGQLQQIEDGFRRLRDDEVRSPFHS